MPNVPGHVMRDESYTLTTAQIDALNSMPPGIYIVCYACRKFQPAPFSLNIEMREGSAAVLCDPCKKMGR